MMATYKRGKIYWYSFWFNGERVQRSTKQGNPRVARQMEAACKTALAKGEVGILERKTAPTLMEFEKRFMDSVKTRCAEKPQTILFYESKMARLLEFTPLVFCNISSFTKSFDLIEDRHGRGGPRKGFRFMVVVP